MREGISTRIKIAVRHEGLLEEGVAEVAVETSVEDGEVDEVAKA